jgi:hypothetical protein
MFLFSGEERERVSSMLGEGRRADGVRACRRRTSLDSFAGIFNLENVSVGARNNVRSRESLWNESAAAART